MAKKAQVAAAAVLVLLDGKKIDDKIASIARRSANLDADIHAAGLQCILHAQAHGDPRKADNLFKALGKAHRAEALKVWFSTFSPIVWNGDKQVGMNKVGAKAFVPFDIEAADANPFWTPKETVTKPLTLAALKAMIASMEKKVDNAEKGGTIAEGENVVDMREFVKRLQAIAA